MLDMRLLFERIKPCISGIMVDKYKVIFVIVNRENW